MFTRRTYRLGLGAVTIGSLAQADVPSHRRVAWPDGHQAAVSLTYDDGLDSQLANAAPELRRFGFKATFFLTRENMEARVADWVALARQGHEIGDHTFHHPCILANQSAKGFERREIIPTEQGSSTSTSAATPAPAPSPIPRRRHRTRTRRSA